jgi:hypothetical protein
MVRYGDGVLILLASCLFRGWGFGGGLGFGGAWFGGKVQSCVESSLFKVFGRLRVMWILSFSVAGGFSV